MTSPDAVRDGAATARQRGQLVIALNNPWHDSAYAVLEDGAVRHVEAERLTRRKYEPLDPLVAMCVLEPHLAREAEVFLVEEGRTYSPFLRAVAQGEKPDPGKLAGKIIDENAALLPAGADTEAVRESLAHVLGRLARGELPFRIYNHHFCHTVNAFLSSPFERALSVSLDGGGMQWCDGRQVLIHGAAYEWSRSESLADKPLLLVTDWSPGYAWDRACVPMGFTAYEAGTVMAMAAYGQRRPVIDALVRSKIFWSAPYSMRRGQGAILRGYDWLFRRLTRTEAGKFSLGYSVQRETERRIRRHLARLLDERGETNLCLSGGTFLNCIAAHKVCEWFPQVREVYVPPVPYDAGLCIGMIQAWLHESGVEEAVSSPIHPFASPPIYTREQVMAACAASGVVPQQDVGVETVAGLLSEGAIVAQFQGGSESGRRALGNRSILCDPRRPENRERLNHTIKRRQWYRPFAPMVLAEQVAQWFDVPARFSSPYMSFAPLFRDGLGEKVPAVLHADGTARVQTVHKELTPRTHALLEAWFARSGVPILLNTSFNDNEPIVETPEQAITTFLSAGIDELYFADWGLLLTHPKKTDGST